MSNNESPVWMPYTQMKTAPAPQMIERAEGIWLYTKEGKKVLDGISSWWVNLHGHARPEIAEAIYKQALKLEQVISAGYSHEPAQELAAKLLTKVPRNLTRLFYSDNGSTAVEVGLKMAFQFFKNQGITTRTKFLTLKNAYHGDTIGSLAVGERDLFSDPFGELLFEVDYITPYYLNTYEEYSLEKETAALEKVKALLDEKGDQYAGITLEPLVQGAAGMLMYPASFLRKLTQLVQSYGILVIADEVMTGFGRTSEWFASIRADISPDIMCFSKGITGGFMTIAATLATEEIYEAFLGDSTKTFYHGHSYTANPIACAAGIASLEIMDKESERNFLHMETWHHEEMRALKDHSRLKNHRITGTIAGMDIQAAEGARYNSRDEIMTAFLERGVLLRPLGNSLYILPPYCIKREELSLIYQTIQDVLNES